MMESKSYRKLIEEYNNEPVRYCNHCLSLDIRHIEEEDVDFCHKCDCTDIGIGSIYDWIRLHEHKYGVDNLKEIIFK